MVAQLSPEDIINIVKQQMVHFRFSPEAVKDFVSQLVRQFPFCTAKWLGLKEAAAYSNIGPKRLVKLAREGKIKGAQDPDDKHHPWFFDRASIDKYREGQLGKDPEREKKIDDIVRSLDI